MQWTKVREKFSAVAAIIIVIVLFTGIAVVAGWDIPVIRDLANWLGMSGQ
ncbi:MAG TPA: hypothetical protein PKI11_08025 [Candidatus Hydrogenedentes bacterium]|nr:hypothetical protein [Candidatus Hydrogenedentota bacterium]HNT87563.1 hypothetical protein [Candidatus Hydrogenedentota bacterium]